MCVGINLEYCTADSASEALSSPWQIRLLVDWYLNHRVIVSRCRTVIDAL
jgi:hypothetical protein